MTYAEKLLDQRWQKKRLELLTAAEWKCRAEFCQNETPNPTLHVHHRIYIRKTDPWDYPEWAYQVLCDECHGVAQQIMSEAYEALAKNPDLALVCSSILRFDKASATSLSRTLNLLIGRIPGLVDPIPELLDVIERFQFSCFVAGSNSARRQQESQK